MVAGALLAATSDSTTTVLIVAAVAILIVGVFVAAAMLARGGGSAASAPRGEVIDAPLHMTLRFLVSDGTPAEVHVVSRAGTGTIQVGAGRVMNADISTGATGDDAAAQLLRWDPSVTRVTVIRDTRLPRSSNVTMPLADICRSAGVSN